MSSFERKLCYALLFLEFLATSSSSDFYEGFNGERPFIVRMTRLICEYEKSSKFVTIDECALKLLRNSSSLISFNATILDPIEPVWTTIKLWYRTNGQIYKPMFGIDEYVEVCQVLANGGGVKPIIRVFYKIFIHYLPQFTRPCPLLGEYSVKNFEFNENIFPPFLPAGDYRTDFEAIHGSNETLFSLHLYGSVRAKGIADLSFG